MAATGTQQGKAIRKQFTSASSADTTTFASAPNMADWAQIIGAGSTVLVVENGDSLTITTDAAEPSALIPGPFTAFTSTTATRVRMGNGQAPQLASVTITAPDYVAGTALTDTATTTVQRVGVRTSFLLAGTMSQGETVTLGTTGAVEGDYIKIIRTSTSAQTCAVVNGGAGAGTLHTQLASKVNFTEARFNGTNWLLSACGPS